MFLNRYGRKIIGPFGQVGGAQVDFGGGELAQPARQLGGICQELEASGGSTIEGRLHIGAKGDGRAKHHDASDEAQVGLLSAEARGQPSFQSGFLLNELLEWVIKPGRAGQRNAIEQPRAVTQRRNAELSTPGHKNKQGDAVGPQHHGIERGVVGSYGLVPQQQRIGASGIALQGGHSGIE